jgi:hypothetical protein
MIIEPQRLKKLWLLYIKHSCINSFHFGRQRILVFHIVFTNNTGSFPKHYLLTALYTGVFTVR